MIIVGISNLRKKKKKRTKLEYISMHFGILFSFLFLFFSSFFVENYGKVYRMSKLLPRSHDANAIMLRKLKLT